MENINKYINIPPGKVIMRKLQSIHMTQVELASKIEIAPQELNAIIKGRRGLPIDLSLKIEKILSFEEGFLSKLQLLNTIETIKKKSEKEMVPPNIRKILFWDSDFNNINWQQSKKYVIHRVEQYGTADEINEIKKYYGL